MKGQKSKLNLLLMEMLLATLFFTLCAAVCVNIFAKAHALSRESEELSQSVLLASTAAETVKGCGGDLAKASERLGGALQDGVLLVLYGDGGEVCEEEETRYLLTVCPQAAEGLMRFAVTVENEQGDVIFTLPVTCDQGGAAYAKW